MQFKTASLLIRINSGAGQLAAHFFIGEVINET
jgi:hypothetical protein